MSFLVIERPRARPGHGVYEWDMRVTEGGGEAFDYEIVEF